MTNEDSLQITIMDWMRVYYPDVLCVHIPNGGSRNKIEAAKLKRMGVTAGMPDIFIPQSGTYYRIVSFFGKDIEENPIEETLEYTGTYHGFICELKIKPNKVKAGSEQERVIKALRAAGYYVCVCFSVDEFVQKWEDYLKDES